MRFLPTQKWNAKKTLVYSTGFSKNEFANLPWLTSGKVNFVAGLEKYRKKFSE